MPGLDPGIDQEAEPMLVAIHHAAAWIAGSSPAMTSEKHA
jgi:hypothetical protein